MNKILCNFAREYLKQGLLKVSANDQFRFKKMYSSRDLDAEINDVVDRMPDDKLDFAMQHIDRSLQLLGIRHDRTTIVKSMTCD